MIRALTIVAASCQKYPPGHQEYPAERAEQNQAHRRWLFADKLTDRQGANDQVCEIAKRFAESVSTILIQS